MPAEPMIDQPVEKGHETHRCSWCDNRGHSVRTCVLWAARKGKPLSAVVVERDENGEWPDPLVYVVEVVLPSEVIERRNTAKNVLDALEAAAKGEA